MEGALRLLNKHIGQVLVYDDRMLVRAIGRRDRRIVVETIDPEQTVPRSYYDDRDGLSTVMAVDLETIDEWLRRGLRMRDWHARKAGEMSGVIEAIERLEASDT